MTGRGRWIVGYTALVVALGSASPVLAGRRADCKRACGARIAACQALNAGFGTLGKGCAKAVVKQCVKAGIGSCEVSSTTTSATTTSTTTTTTTTSSTTTTFPLLVTGQTQCWNASGIEVPCGGTGQDGDVRAGAPFAYRDNGDGTITDLNTGLIWEKLSDDDSIHDKDTLYTWVDAFDVKIAALNTPPCFAGHCDWRLPNRRELESLVHGGDANPAISLAFNTNCMVGCTVLTCSCTNNSAHWSSSTYHFSPDFAWFVDFFDGEIGGHMKKADDFVRAVRGGS